MIKYFRYDHPLAMSGQFTEGKVYKVVVYSGDSGRQYNLTDDTGWAKSFHSESTPFHRAFTPTVKHPRLAAGERGTRNASFVVFYTDQYHHFANTNYDVRMRSQKFSLFGMVMRLNGTQGFPGGMVELGETLAEGAVREANEEVNSEIVPEDITLHSSHYIDEYTHAHLFTCKKTVEELYEIQQYSSLARDARSEGSGFLVHTSYEPALRNLIASPLADTVCEELHLLIGDIIQ